MLEETSVVIDDFGGLYNRGDDDNIPLGHFKTCYNFIFDRKQIATRPGITDTYLLNFRPMKVFLGIINSDRFFLILDDNSGIHRDNGPVIMSLPPTMFDFSALNLFNRIYISPNEGTRADANNHFLWVYDGANAPRLAGGVKPTSGVTAADGAAGVVSKGDHQLAVCFVTNTGFITPPNATLTTYTAPGLKKISLTNIPLGPAECVGRRILSTKAGEEELFFVPGGGIINDNTSTTATLDYADTDLIASADYLNDIYERPPAGTQLVFYRGRLCIVGANNLVRISLVEDPETFSTVDGFLAIPSEDYVANPPVAGWVLRDTLYISKFPGVFGVQDTGDPSPNNWPVAPVDESIGCYPNGIGSYTASFSARSTSDHNIILTQQGIFLFDGVFRRPPMTWKIETLWQQVVDDEINNIFGTNYNFWRFTVSHDIVQKRFFVNAATLVPQPLTPLQWFILHGDYSLGWDAVNIKWSFWYFPFVTSSCVMALHPVDNKYTLRVTSFLDTKLRSIDMDQTTDSGTVIPARIETGPIDKVPGWLHFFLGIRLRMSGVVTLGLQYTDGVLTTGSGLLTAIVSLVVNSTVARDFLRLCNFTSERARLTIYGEGPFKIHRMELTCKPQFPQRPQL